MVISKETIDKIRDSVNIVEIIQGYLPNIKKSGKDYKTNCPFHQEKTPSFFISPQKSIFHCFGCNTGGDVFTFIMKYENISYPDAIKKVAVKTGIQIKESELNEYDNSERKLLLKILNSTAEYYNKILLEEPCAESARKYLQKRQISSDTIEKFKLGFAPDNNRILTTAGKKYDVNLLLKSGIISISSKTNAPHDHLRNRISFPIYDLHGNIIAFGGRILPELNINPPYLNTPETVLYNKSRCLYGLHQANMPVRQSGKAVILEGYMDVLISHQYGINNTVAPLGTALTHDQIKLLKRFTDTLVILFDPDDSGQQAAVRASELVLEENLNCYITSLPDGLDPDEFILNENGGKEKFLDLINNTPMNPIEFKLFINKSNLSKPEYKRRMAKEVLDMINKIKDTIYRYEMVKIASNKLGIREDILLNELSKLSSTNKNAPAGPGQKETADTQNTIIFSVEEEIIALCLQYPELLNNVNRELLSDERCIKLLDIMAKPGMAALSDILNSVDEDTSTWVTKLGFKEYDDTVTPELLLNNFIKDLSLRRQEEKRKQLEIEIIPMLEGSIPADYNKLTEFQELTKTLKGSIAKR